jgi:hypothetical protein
LGFSQILDERSGVALRIVELARQPLDVGVWS